MAEPSLRIVEQAYLSDTGRQREANEDSFFAGAPVFGVADGMGGAQAGEVASRVAAESFRSVDRGDASPEGYLREIAETANRRIHELALEDSSRSGMGTTFTAALVEEEEISIGHVGDSRAYVFRDGELKMLTSDHSLVEELRRQGRLTEEQAEDHPQRSIITRALGPEPEVEVDTMTYRTRPGDVYLLCSDGLTSMVKDDQIKQILASAPSLEAAARDLIAAANEAGGRDNITAVLFRLAEAGAVAEDEDAVGPDAPATLVGPAAVEAGEQISAERERMATARERHESRQHRRPVAPEKRSRGRTALKVLAVLLILGVVVAGAIYGARQIYFLGVNDSDQVALYRGLPYELPFDIKLYSEQEASVPIDMVPPDRQGSAVNHELRSKEDAEDLLNDLSKSASANTAESGGGGTSGGQGANKQSSSGDGSGGGKKPGGPSG
jgi:protein phosphatase